MLELLFLFFLRSDHSLPVIAGSFVVLLEVIVLLRHCGAGLARLVIVRPVEFVLLALIVIDLLLPLLLDL